MKRIVDLIVSFFGLLLMSPVLIIFVILIFIEDRHYPFYIAKRVGKGGVHFKMIKLRSMVVNADANKVDSTSSNDPRITKLGNFIRRFKIDEIPNLINILTFKMSFVGPRPNVEREVNLYTNEELKILRMRPGITDISSIVFADEGDILENSKDPDLDYNQLIRPWKSRLAIFYTENVSLFLDLQLMILTLFNFINRDKTLSIISKIIENFGADKQLTDIVLRKDPLVPTTPPGSSHIVLNRGI